MGNLGMPKHQASYEWPDGGKDWRGGEGRAPLTR